MSYDREKRRLRRKRNLVAKELHERRRTEFKQRIIDSKKKKLVLEQILKEEDNG